MAICPFAVQQLIPESSRQGEVRMTTAILHRAVSSADSLRDYWNSPGVEVESHFYVGEHGTVYQFMDTDVRADANVLANSFAVSIETWDGGNTPDDMPWNPAQVAALKRLVLWICDTHGIPKRAATSWNAGGIGGHNWFPTEWAGGPRGCPGTARNKQIRDDIIPAVARGEVEDETVDINDVKFLLSAEVMSQVDPDTELPTDKLPYASLAWGVKYGKHYAEKSLWVGLRNEALLTEVLEHLRGPEVTNEGIAAALEPKLRANLGGLVGAVVAQQLEEWDGVDLSEESRDRFAEELVSKVGRMLSGAATGIKAE